MIICRKIKFQIFLSCSQRNNFKKWKSSIMTLKCFSTSKRNRQITKQLQSWFDHFNRWNCNCKPWDLILKIINSSPRCKVILLLNRGLCSNANQLLRCSHELISIMNNRGSCSEILFKIYEILDRKRSWFWAMWILLQIKCSLAKFKK